MKYLGVLIDEKGFALVLSLVIMAAMTAIGIAAVTTSTTDMLIARNEREAKKAFFLAETGVHEAIGRLDLAGTNARYMGEDSAERIARIAAGENTADLTFAADTFTESSLGLDALEGTYTVTLEYAFEDAATTWCDLDGCANEEVVLFCVPFKFSGIGVPDACDDGQGQPIYKITSTGVTLVTGTRATVTYYMATSTLNVVPPGNTILFTEGDIDAGGADKVDGNVASAESTGGVVSNCSGTCVDVGPISNASWTTGDMDKYLGYSVEDLLAYADSPSPYYHTGASALTPDTSEWGDVCNDTDLTAADGDLHICDNESKLIYIKNDGAGVGPVKVQANSRVRGIILVTGDMETAGDLLLEGSLFVMGTLKIVGTVTVFGTIMVQGDGPGVGAFDDVNVQGSLNIFGSVPVATSVGDAVGIPRFLRWVRG